LYPAIVDYRVATVDYRVFVVSVFQGMHHKVALPMSTVKLEEGEAPLLYCATWYLIKHRSMTPEAALDHVRSIRPRVLLAPSQWQAIDTFMTLIAGQLPIRSTNLGSFLEAVEACRTNTENDEYHAMEFDNEDSSLPITQIMLHRPASPTQSIDVVLITEADLEGYDKYVDMRKDALEVATRRPIMRRLSCLFGSLKITAAVCQHQAGSPRFAHAR